MTELPLDLILAGVSGRSKAGAQRVPRKFSLPVRFRKIAAHAGGKGGALDQAHDVLVVEPGETYLLTVLRHTTEQRSVRDAGEVEPSLQRHNGAGVIT